MTYTDDIDDDDDNVDIRKSRSNLIDDAICLESFTKKINENKKMLQKESTT